MWTWAPGHPPTLPPPRPHSRSSLRDWLARLRAWLLRNRGLCGFLTPGDARWRARACSDAVVTACRGVDSPPGGTGNWTLGYARRGVCPQGSEWAPPRTPREADALAAALTERRHDGAWLPVDAAGGWVVRGVT